MGDKNSANYPTEVMNTLSGANAKNWEKSSGEIESKIRDATASENSFSDIPSLKSFAKVYLAAKEVYLETMRGAAQDLKDAAEGIKESAKQMEERDSNAGDAFIKLRDRWDASGLAAQKRYEEATSRRKVQEAASTVQGAGESESSTPSENEGALPTDPKDPTPVTENQIPTTTTEPNEIESKDGETEEEKQYNASQPQVEKPSWKK